MKLRFWPLSLVALLALSLLAACSTPENQVVGSTPGQEISVTDMLGRPVTLPAPADRVVAIGSGALRLYVYAGNLAYVAGVEQVETGDVTGKPYMLANPGLAALPVIGLGGPNNAPDPEKLLAVEPDVIFSTHAFDAAAADLLQVQTGIPVVALNYGQTDYGETNLLSEELLDSLLLIGQVTGDNTRANAVVDFLRGALQDLDRRTRDIPDAEKPSVYIGGLGAKGAHGIESTQGNCSLLAAIHAQNVVDETGWSGSLMVDREMLLEWDPELLFIDQGGYAAVQEDYRVNQVFYQALSAVKQGNVFSQLPYNAYNTNIETALANAYFLGKVIYPDAFTDVDPALKAGEIYQAFLGQDLYPAMVENFGGFGALTLVD